MRFAILRLAAVLCVGPVPLVLAAAPPALKLENGQHWSFQGAQGMTMALDVDACNATGCDVRWSVNGALGSTLRLRPDGRKVFLTSVARKGAFTRYSKKTLFLDFDAPAGKTWKNAYGTFRVESTQAAVALASGVTLSAIQTSVVLPGGGRSDWYVTPDQGFVALGAKTAFKLAVPSLPTKSPAVPQ